MLDSATEGMDALKIDSTKTKEIGQYADMVISGFHALIEKREDDSDGEDRLRGGSDSSDADSFSDDLPRGEAKFFKGPFAKGYISQANSSSDQDFCSQEQIIKARKDAWDQLKSNLLPLLKHLMNTMCLSLNPRRLVEDPALNLQIVLDIQPQIDRTLEQIKSATNILCPREAKVSPQCDHDLQEFKSFRLDPLEIRLRYFLWNETLHRMTVLCQTIERLGFSHAHSRSRHNNVHSIWMPLEVIDFAMEQLKQSEFDLVRRGWSTDIDSITGTLAIWMEMINPTTAHKQVVQIVKSLLPIMKLSRSLFRKLQHKLQHEKHLPFVTEMCSVELKLLHEFPTKVARWLHIFLRVLRTASHSGVDLYGFDFPGQVRLLQAAFNSPLPIISRRIIPLIPETDILSGQTSFKTWYTTWCHLFGIAMQNLDDMTSF